MHHQLHLPGLWNFIIPMETSCFRYVLSHLLPTKIFRPRTSHSQVSNVLYRLHKSVLAARLDLFGGMFMLSDGQHQPGDGRDDEHAVRIEDGVAVREDFEALIKHIYGQCVFQIIVAWTAD